MTKYRIYTSHGLVDFEGEHLPDMETDNWHYYRKKDGVLIHFRKEHMIMVQSGEETPKAKVLPNIKEEMPFSGSFAAVWKSNGSYRFLSLMWIDDGLYAFSEKSGEWSSFDGDGFLAKVRNVFFIV